MMAANIAQILPIHSEYFELLMHDCIVSQIVVVAADNAARLQYRPLHTSMEHQYEQVCEEKEEINKVSDFMLLEKFFVVKKLKL